MHTETTSGHLTLFRQYRGQAKKPAEICMTQTAVNSETLLELMPLLDLLQTPDGSGDRLQAILDGVETLLVGQTEIIERLDRQEAVLRGLLQQNGQSTTS
jgi:hypothetical protein